MGPLAQPSPGERRVLKLLAHGKSNKSIAYALGMSLSMVKKHVSRMIRALHLENRAQLLLWAIGHPECVKGVAVPVDVPHELLRPFAEQAVA